MQRLTATMRKGIQRRARFHFNTRRARLAVCWTRQQSVKRTAMQSHLCAFRWRQSGDPFEVVSKSIDELEALTAGRDRFIFVNRTWLTLAQAHELFPRKD